MKKLVVVLMCFSSLAIFPSCKKSGTPAELKSAGINLTVTRQRTLPDIKIIKYDGSKAVDSATLTPDANKVFFIDHKWLNKNRLRIVNENALIDEDIITTVYLYNLSQQNNTISESLSVNFTFRGKTFFITDINRIVDVTLP